jgi:hypothetical protein
MPGFIHDQLPEAGIEKAAAPTAPAVPPDNPVPIRDGAILELERAAWTGRI